MWLLCLLLAFGAWIIDRILHRDHFRQCSEIPGPESPVPIIGSAWLFFFLDSPKEFFDTLIGYWKKYKRLYRLEGLRKMAIVLHNYKDFEVILSSNTLLDKGESYDSVVPWLGYGLLTSTGDKWRSRRKLITPSFHFKILTEFLDIFNKNGKVVCDLLEKEVDKPAFNVYKYVQLLALENIYESAMGTNMNVQRTPDIKYVSAVKKICYILNVRGYQLLLRSELMFKLSHLYKGFHEAVEYVHKNTDSIIMQRRKELKSSNRKFDQNDHDIYDGKNKFAFLDMLLLQEESQKLTNEDIREEVDTFMFEGHDTVTSALSFLLYELSRHPNIQEAVYREQMEIVGDAETPPCFNDVPNMKYLDMVIKEAQRLYPSVPLVERMVTEETQLPGGIKLRKGNQVTLFIWALHRDPDIWNEPDVFNPDNFLPEAILKRNPYAYVPFSAGPRNCIGQKFALLEMKCTISKIVRKFKLLPSEDPKHDLQLSGELVLISKSGFHIKLERRNSN